MTLLNLIPFIPGVLIAALALVHGQMQPAHAQTPIQPTSANTRNDPNFYVGMWVTADGFIRHELLRGGRYDEARGTHQSAYRGNYSLKADHIEYKDDTGFTATGDFEGGVLYHAGMVLYREQRK